MNSIALAEHVSVLVLLTTLQTHFLYARVISRFALLRTPYMPSAINSTRDLATLATMLSATCSTKVHQLIKKLPDRRSTAVVGGPLTCTRVGVL
jgi:hypothetical protein